MSLKTSQFTRTRAFTLLDLLVSLAVVVVLISVLLPTLGAVRETTRRVVCASNQRQVGLGIQMFADANRGNIPPSVFMAPSPTGSHISGTYTPEDTMTLRIGTQSAGSRSLRSGWDGLGVLYQSEYLRTPEIYYCPSHKGFHEYPHYAEIWNDESKDIIGNYQYRAISPRGDRQLSTLADANLALVTDGFRTKIDFNHESGANVLRADLSMFWFSDPQSKFTENLPDDETGVSSTLVDNAWQLLDRAINGKD